MQITSPTTTVDKSQEEMFHLLSDVRNFEKLMPDSTSMFEIKSEDTFTFALKGMPQISLTINEKQEFDRIVMGAADSKISFSLTANINQLAAKQSEVQLVFEGEFNAMMGMMIKGPITNFIGTLIDNMKRL
ncbi:SRPBCC family protein [Sinomicrobium sp.]